MRQQKKKKKNNGLQKLTGERCLSKLQCIWKIAHQKPCLAIIIIESDVASDVYIRNKGE